MNVGLDTLRHNLLSDSQLCKADIIRHSVWDASVTDL